MTYSVILPTLNEKNHIIQLIEEIARIFQKVKRLLVRKSNRSNEESKFLFSLISANSFLEAFSIGLLIPLLSLLFENSSSNQISEFFYSFFI